MYIISSLPLYHYSYYMRSFSSSLTSSFDNMDASTATAIVIVLWLFCLLIGNPMLVGLIHFEKYGEDPLKRNLIDMVSTWFRVWLSQGSNLFIPLALYVAVLWISVNKPHLATSEDLGYGNRTRTSCDCLCVLLFSRHVCDSYHNDLDWDCNHQTAGQQGG